MNGVGYNLNAIVWEDQEWGYTSKFSYGQLVINGNGAQIVGNLDINFMYVGSDANVVLNNVTVRFFNHVFMNHGNLLCKDSIFRDNSAYKFDVGISGSGAVVHNYNAVVFDHCGFYNNNASYHAAVTTLPMECSILYAEPYSLNIFKQHYGEFRSNSLYCSNYSTTIVYDSYGSNYLHGSYIAANAYYALVDYKLFSSNLVWVVNVTNVAQLKSVFWALNTFVNASSVGINLAPGEYSFSNEDYWGIRGFDWRANVYKEYAYVSVRDDYLLDVGFCPITIMVKVLLSL